MTPLMEILQNRISTVACKTLRVSHISHRPHHQLINEPDSTLKKLVPCPKNGEHLRWPAGHMDLDSNACRFIPRVAG